MEGIVGMEGMVAVQGSGWKFHQYINPCMGCRCCGQVRGCVPSPLPALPYLVECGFISPQCPRGALLLFQHISIPPLCPLQPLAQGLQSFEVPVMRGTDFPPPPENPA